MVGTRDVGECDFVYRAQPSLGSGIYVLVDTLRIQGVKVKVSVDRTANNLKQAARRRRGIYNVTAKVRLNLDSGLLY